LRAHGIEIEHSTSVYTGLLRFNDVMIDFPIPQAFVVDDGEKTRAKFEREIARRTFEYSKLRDVTQLLLYDQVRETWNRYKQIGAGSQARVGSRRRHLITHRTSRYQCCDSGSCLDRR
jgi:hypothetical protein